MSSTRSLSSPPSTSPLYMLLSFLVVLFCCACLCGGEDRVEERRPDPVQTRQMFDRALDRGDYQGAKMRLQQLSQAGESIDDTTRQRLEEAKRQWEEEERKKRIEEEKLWRAELATELAKEADADVEKVTTLVTAMEKRELELEPGQREAMEALQRQEDARKFRALLERGESVIKDREQCEDGAKLKEVWRELSKSTAESNPEHGDAKKLAKKLERCRKRAVKKASKGACELLGGLREEYVERLDRIFLDQGMDVRLKLRGKCKTSLTLDYVLWNRATVHQFVQAGDFLSSTEKLGFKKLVFSSFDETYTYTLTPKNMLDDILLNQGIFYAFELK